MSESPNYMTMVLEQPEFAAKHTAVLENVVSAHTRVADAVAVHLEGYAEIFPPIRADITKLIFNGQVKREAARMLSDTSIEDPPYPTSPACIVSLQLLQAARGELKELCVHGAALAIKNPTFASMSHHLVEQFKEYMLRQVTSSIATSLKAKCVPDELALGERVRAHVKSCMPPDGPKRTKRDDVISVTTTEEIVTSDGESSRDEEEDEDDAKMAAAQTAFASPSHSLIMNPNLGPSAIGSRVAPRITPGPVGIVPPEDVETDRLKWVDFLRTRATEIRRILTNQPRKAPQEEWVVDTEVPGNARLFPEQVAAMGGICPYIDIRPSQDRLDLMYRVAYAGVPITTSTVHGRAEFLYFRDPRDAKEAALKVMVLFKSFKQWQAMKNGVYALNPALVRD